MKNLNNNKKILTKSNDCTMANKNERVLSLLFCEQPVQPFESANKTLGTA